MAKRRHRPRPETLCDFCDLPIPRGGPIVFAAVICDHQACELVLHEGCRDLVAASLGVTAGDAVEVGGGLLQRWA
jgi:hypothetical protein